jgi:hypothetical protein
MPPLPASAESLDKIPEAFRSEYEQRDGKFHLKLEGEPHGYVSKSKLDEFRTNNIELDRKAKELEEKFAKYKGIDPDQARADREEAKKLKDQKLIDAGQLDELVNQRVADRETAAALKEAELQKDRDKERDEKEQLQRELSQRIRSDAIRDLALSKRFAVKPAKIGLITMLAEHGDHEGVRWAPNEKREMVATKNGQPAFSHKKAGEPLGLEEWLEGVLKENPEFLLTSSGGGATGSTAGGGNAVDLSLPPTERVKAFRRSQAAA